MFISSGEAIGPSACSSSVAARPSQNSASAHATLSSVGLRRFSVFEAWPTPRPRPSPHEKPGLWQVAQEITPDAESRGSKNSARPSSTRALLKALSAGNGAAAGRSYFDRSAGRTPSGASLAGGPADANGAAAPASPAPSSAAQSSLALFMALLLRSHGDVEAHRRMDRAAHLGLARRREGHRRLLARKLRAHLELRPGGAREDVVAHAVLVLEDDAIARAQRDALL